MSNLNVVPWHMLKPDLSLDPQDAIMRLMNDGQHLASGGIYDGSVNKEMQTVMYHLRQPLEAQENRIKELEERVEELLGNEDEIKSLELEEEKLQAKVEELENKLEKREEQLRIIQEAVKEVIDEV